MATASQRARTPVALAAEKKLGPRAQLTRSHTPHLLDPAVSAAKKRYNEAHALANVISFNEIPKLVDELQSTLPEVVTTTLARLAALIEALEEA